MSLQSMHDIWAFHDDSAYSAICSKLSLRSLQHHSQHRLQAACIVQHLKPDLTSMERY